MASGGPKLFYFVLYDLPPFCCVNFQKRTRDRSVREVYLYPGTRGIRIPVCVRF